MRARRSFGGSGNGNASKHARLLYRGVPSIPMREPAARAHAVWIDDDSDVSSAILRGGLKVLRFADRVAAIGEGKPPPPYRYCWPPVGG